MDNHSGKTGNFPGKWELKKAEVIRGADSLEITKLVSEFNVYASIIDPTIVGELLVIDGRNILSGLPVQGGDLVKLSIDITGEIREYTLRIAQIKNISDLETQRMYIIQCVSNLFFESFHQKLSQSFEGQLNDDIRFRFFQDTKGFYNFMPIEKALTNYKDNPPFEFVYRGNASGDKDFFAIKNLVFNPASYDLGKALREGYLKGRAFDINISKKTLGVVDYDYFKIFDKKDYLNDYPSYYKQDFGVGKIKMDLSTAGSKKTNLSDLKRTSVTDYNQLVQITIFGNSEIDVGQVVELDIPNPDPGDNKEQDKLWAGKYYVIGKRDLYTGDNCSMVLDCAKESMGIEL